MLQLEMQASLLNLPPEEAVFGKTEDIEAFLTEAEYDGLQYVPLRTPRRHRFTELARAGLVTSFHQSWAHGVSPRALAYRAVLSGVTASTRRILELQNNLPQNVPKLPVVVHPNEQYLDDRPPTWDIDYPELRNSHMLPLLYQPTVEVLQEWNVGNYILRGNEAAELLGAVQLGRGFAGVALDLHHLTTRRAGRQLHPKWVDAFVAEVAAGGLRGPSEVQVSLRPDFGGRRGDVRRAVEGGLASTRIGELLGIVLEKLPSDQESLRVTVEVPPGAFKELDGYRAGNAAVVAAISQLPGIRNQS